MKKQNKIKVLIATALTLSSLSTVVYSQGMGSPFQDHGMSEEMMNEQFEKGGHGGVPMSVDSIENANKIVDHIKQKHQKMTENLKNKLNITPAQESVWSNYVESGKSNMPTANDILTHFKAMKNGHTPENMQMEADFMQEQTANQQNMVNAYKELYNSATVEQQKILKYNNPMMGPANFGPNNFRGDRRGSHKGGKRKHKAYNN